MIERFSLAGRIVLVTALSGAAVILAASLALVSNARHAIAVETDANRVLARNYVIATIGSLLRDNAPEDLISFLPGALYQPRHARILVVDRTSGILHQPEPPHAAETAEAAVPGWFRALLAPPANEVRLPVRVNGRTFGDVIVIADPFDEIAEIWQDFRALGMIAGAAYVVTLVLLWIVVNRTLRPLERMTGGIERLGDGDFSVRIGEVHVPDLRRLGRCIDALGAALQRTLSEKDELNRRMVSVQDEERRIIARELHDEFGPCLFGLKVEAQAMLEEGLRMKAEPIVASARSLLAIAARIEGTNDDLLARLRPMELGELPLPQVLEDLVDGLRAMAPALDWSIEIAPDPGFPDETTSLTVYRVVQEAVTNVLRHARARRIGVTVQPDPTRDRWLRVIVEDDGIGLSSLSEPGTGLRGMRERIEALSGVLDIAPGAAGGLCVRAAIPLASSQEAVGEQA